MLFGTIFDLSSFKAFIESMDNEIRIGPGKEVVIRMVWEIDKLDRCTIEQSGGVHAKYAGENTFMLGP